MEAAVLGRRHAGGCSRSLRQAGHLQHRPGSQFTGAAFTGTLDQERDRHQHGRQRRLRDNVFVRAGCGEASIREVYLRAYDSGR